MKPRDQVDIRPFFPSSPTSETMAVVLMNGAPSWVLRKPPRDALSVEPTEALQPRHRDAHLKLLQTDCALRTIHAVLLGCKVREHARSPGCHTRALTGGRSAVSAVGRDAPIDMCFPQGLGVVHVLGRQLAVTDRTLVLFGKLWWIRWQWSSMCRGSRRRRLPNLEHGAVPRRSVRVRR